MARADWHGFNGSAAQGSPAGHRAGHLQAARGRGTGLFDVTAQGRTHDVNASSFLPRRTNSPATLDARKPHSLRLHEQPSIVHSRENRDL